MINIYGKNNTNYNTNGDATLIPIRADLTITLNGSWQLEVEVPYDKEKRYELIEEGAVIICDVGCIRELASIRQRFRIYDYKKGISSVTAIAFPVAMESTHDAPIDNLVISGKTGVQAMAQIQAKTSKYNLYSDITRTGSTSFANTNVNNAIASGSDGCFIDVWGGEIVYDNLNFSVLNRVGNNEQDKHKIIYGKDITDISYEKDDSGLITRIYPISSDGIRLNGSGYVDSPKVSQYPIVHSRYMSAPYKLIEDDIASSTATAQLTRSIKSQITTLASSLSHSVYNTAVASKVEPEYIRKIKADILSAVQSMATANIYNADANKVMQSAIKDGMEWLKDVSKAEWVWHGSDATGWWYGSSTSDRATSQYVYIDRVWSYFGDNSLWQKPRDDASKKWDWIQEASGKRYGNKDKYYAQKTYVYITMDGQMKEYYFDDDGIWDESDDTDSDYAWHGSGSSSDPYWFGDDSTTGKYLKDGWWFIDGTYYYFDSEGYWDNETKFDDYQWDWVETADGKYWFGNPDKTFAMTYVTNQWLKVGGDWYRFDANGYAVGDTALENEVIARFTSGMAQLKTLCETLNTQAFNLLYSQMRSYCTKMFNTGIDVPSVTITVNMADLSNTSEYANYQHLEKVYLGDSVTALDYKHNISAVERIVSITYDCIKKVNAVVEIGVASSSLSDILKTDAGGSVAGGFDTSVIESTLTSHTNELARLDSAKQDKLTAGENIEIINNVISATGGGHGDCTCHYGVGAPAETLGIDGDIYVEMSPNSSGCADSITYQRSSNLNNITNSYSDGFHKIEGSWWTDRYEHSYTTYRIDGLTAGKTYDVILKVKVKNLVQEYESSSELFGIAIQNNGSFTTLSEHVKNGEFAYYEDGNDKIYFQSLKPMTTKVQSYSFKFTAFSSTYILISPDSIVNDSTIPMDIEIAISDGTIGNYIEDVYYKVEGEWLLYDNDTKYVAGDNITITEVDGENVISATDTDAIEDLTDVDLDNLSNGQVLKYNSTTQKWENENESGGGGGSDVEANPTDPATDTLTTIGIDGTVYDIAGGGGNALIMDAQIYSLDEQVVGVWTDGKPLYQKTYVIDNPSTTPLTIETINNLDTMVNFQGSFYRMSKWYEIDGRTETSSYNSYGCNWGITNNQIQISFQGYSISEIEKIRITVRYTKTTDAAGSGGYQAYGFSPVIYSTEEREIGVWTDNKPLYQKTVIKSGNISQRETISLGIANVENIFLVSDASNVNNGQTPLPLVTGTDNSNNTGGFFDIQQSDTSFLFRIGSGMVGYVENAIITVQYTKTTDVAGSGSYNTLGVPTVHYTTDEQVIGTYTDGNGVTKPVYQRTQIGGISLTSVGVWYDTSFTNIDQVLDVRGTILRDDEQVNLGYFSNSIGTCWICRNNNIKIQLAAGQSGETYALDKLTIQYTKTTDV